MKGAPTEFGHIADAVLRLALPHPGVAFRLINNGKKSLDLPATDAVSRLLAAWPDEFHEQRLPLEVRDAEIRITGIVGLPELARPTAKHQYLYLNGRHIRDKFIQHALRESFRGLTEPGRHPAAILLIQIPPGDVDVNVHPTKIEVRFKDSGRIHGLVLSGVREKLLGSDLTPSAVPMRADNFDTAVMCARRWRRFFSKYQEAWARRKDPLHCSCTRRRGRRRRWSSQRRRVQGSGFRVQRMHSPPPHLPISPPFLPPRSNCTTPTS